MNGETPGSQGLVALCRADGTIIRTLRDDLGACRDQREPSLESIVHRDSADKVRHFIAALKEEHATFGWEMNVQLRSQLTPMHFAGARTTEGLLVIAALSRNAIVQLSEEMMRINNEQGTALRSALKELSLKQREQTEREHKHFDELSLLNNELVNLQRELAQKNHQLARMNEMKNHFLGMASHDLRKPLAVILTNAEFIDQPGISGYVAESLQVIRDAARGIMRSLDDFIDIAQIESGKLKLELEAVELSALLESRVKLLKPPADAKKIPLQFQPVELPEVQMDRRRMAQVVDNLIENAIKYSPLEKNIRVKVWRDGDNILFSVSDEGKGIPKEKQARLFLPFATTGSATSGGEKSTGLGLAIVKAIVRAHSGNVWLDDKSVTGATFVVSLPCAAVDGE